jgi:hypothetical protein
MVKLAKNIFNWPSQTVAGGRGEGRSREAE